MRGSFGSMPADAWRRGFLRRFRREVAQLMPSGTGGVVDRTAASAQALFEERQQEVPDRPGLLILGMSALILAGYRELVAEGTDRHTAYEAVRRPFLTMLRRPTRAFVRVLGLVSRDPLRLLSRVPYAGVLAKAYGRTMGFEQRVAADRVDVVVTRCAFNRFFVEHGEPLLVRIVCEWDRNWIDALNASRRPIRVERPLTLSTGFDRCEFQHVRATATAREALDVVLERRPEVVARLSEPKV